MRLYEKQKRLQRPKTSVEGGRRRPMSGCRLEEEAMRRASDSKVRKEF